MSYYCAIRLIAALEAYESAERANAICPGYRAQEAKADQLHAVLTHLCIASGFQPGGVHRHLSIVQYARQRAAELRRVFPNA